MVIDFVCQPKMLSFVKCIVTSESIRVRGDRLIESN